MSLDEMFELASDSRLSTGGEGAWAGEAAWGARGGIGAGLREIGALALRILQSFAAVLSGCPLYAGLDRGRERIRASLTDINKKTELEGD